jgi:hypothetical protein
MNWIRPYVVALFALCAMGSGNAQEKPRTERDLLGEKQVPADAYYGVQTARALENFQISGIEINHYPGFVEAWAIVKLAAAKANTDVGAMKLYGATSHIFGQYGHPKEFIIGGNYYPWNSRNARLNIQLINVDHSPVSSTFGFYLGQLTGQVFSIGMTAFY